MCDSTETCNERARVTFFTDPHRTCRPSVLPTVLLAGQATTEVHGPLPCARDASAWRSAAGHGLLGLRKCAQCACDDEWAPALKQHLEGGME